MFENRNPAPFLEVNVINMCENKYHCQGREGGMGSLNRPCIHGTLVLRLSIVFLSRVTVRHSGPSGVGPGAGQRGFLPEFVEADYTYSRVTCADVYLFVLTLALAPERAVPARARPRFPGEVDTLGGGRVKPWCLLAYKAAEDVYVMPNEGGVYGHAAEAAGGLPCVVEAVDFSVHHDGLVLHAAVAAGGDEHSLRIDPCGGQWGPCSFQLQSGHLRARIP